MITVTVVLPLWWIFYELIYVEIAMLVSVMKVDAYYVLRSYILVMIKHVYESVCSPNCVL